MIDSGDLAVGADAFMLHGLQVVEGVEFVRWPGVDHMRLDGLPEHDEVWKTIRKRKQRAGWADTLSGLFLDIGATGIRQRWRDGKDLWTRKTGQIPTRWVRDVMSDYERGGGGRPTWEWLCLSEELEAIYAHECGAITTPWSFEGR